MIKGIIIIGPAGLRCGAVWVRVWVHGSRSPHRNYGLRQPQRGVKFADSVLGIHGHRVNCPCQVVPIRCYADSVHALTEY